MGAEYVAVKVGVVQVEKVNDQMSQSRRVLRDDILILSGRSGVTDRGGISLRGHSSQTSSCTL